MTYVWVGAAGVVGTLLRYVLGLSVQRFVPSTVFPFGTLAVNLLGCLALGWFSHWMMDTNRLSPRIRAAVSAGLLGSFTTFSTFSVEAVQLFQHGLWWSGLVYVGISMFGRWGMVWLGARVGVKKKRVQHG